MKSSLHWALPIFIGRYVFLFLLFFGVMSFSQAQEMQRVSEKASPVKLVVLGTVQDAGSPHTGCSKACCKELFDKPDPTRKVVSLGVIDEEYQQVFMFEATPDFPTQLELLHRSFDSIPASLLNGVFLTHAHIGHYTGLMYLGFESINAKETPVFAMPKMATFLRSNGPWNQLVNYRNISIREMSPGGSIQLTPNLHVTPFLVPHRDEYSETAGFIIEGPYKAAVFIPDIDKWEKWDRNISEMVENADYAFLDATFFDAAEVGHRDISVIPHPFVIETMRQFNTSGPEEKAKIHFIHLNHTNPLLDLYSPAAEEVIRKGYNIALFGEEFRL